MLRRAQFSVQSLRELAAHYSCICPAQHQSSMSPAACGFPRRSSVSLDDVPEVLPLAELPSSGIKSVKRKAAEALLQSRHIYSPVCRGLTDSPCKRRHFSSDVQVHLCTTRHVSDPDQEQATQAQSSGLRWCSLNVCVPHLDWSTIVTAPAIETHTHATPHCLRGPSHTIADEVDIYVVDRPNQVAEALERLKDSMKDSVVAIDLEWKPDHVRDTSKVALMQLSSSTCCVLIRICKLKPQQLPEALIKFLR